MDKLMPLRKSVKAARALVQWSLVEVFIVQFFLPPLDLEMYRSYDVITFIEAIPLTLTLMAIDVAVIEGYGIDGMEKELDESVSEEMKVEEAKELWRDALGLCVEGNVRSFLLLAVLQN